jgi:adenylate cyclase
MIGWINESLGLLSDCALDNGGVLVDYVGDELMAMWGAPVDQKDHAKRACRAAMAMLRRLPELDEKWSEDLGIPTQVGIGVNSGPALVGNTGSIRKFKYGPLGRTVNLGSRVQGATKWLRSPLLITEMTANCLENDEEFPIRRLCRVRVVNLNEPVTLFELAVDPTDQWHDLRLKYEQALQAFESREFLHATQTLGGLLKVHSQDGPSMSLLSRAVEAMQSPHDFDDVWILGGK